MGQREVKAKFANDLCRFMAADFKESLFTKALYQRLSCAWATSPTIIATASSATSSGTCTARSTSSNRRSPGAASAIRIHLLRRRSGGECTAAKLQPARRLSRPARGRGGECRTRNASTPPAEIRGRQRPQIAPRQSCIPAPRQSPPVARRRRTSKPPCSEPRMLPDRCPPPQGSRAHARVPGFAGFALAPVRHDRGRRGGSPRENGKTNQPTRSSPWPNSAASIRARSSPTRTTLARRQPAGDGRPVAGVDHRDRHHPAACRARSRRRARRSRPATAA